MRVILDVDTGVDDALAIALALRHPRLQLEAVVTVAGNVSLELTTSQHAARARLAGRNRRSRSTWRG